MTKNELKYVNSLKEENERVKNMLLRFVDAVGKLKNIDDVVNMALIPMMTEENQKIRCEIKAEAYKECLDELARRLGYAFLSKHSCVLDIMENLLNELVGDGDGKRKD